MIRPTIGVVLEERFRRLPNGRLFSPNGFGDLFWKRYVDAFGGVSIVARVEAAETAQPSWTEVTLLNALIAPIEPYLGPVGFLRRAPRVAHSFWRATCGLDAMIVRAPGTLALMAAFALRYRHRPFAVELVGDPMDVFGTGIGGRLGPVMRNAFVRNVSWLCEHADGVSYVTREALQRRYPSKSSAMTIAASSVQLPLGVFAKEPRMAVVSDDSQIFCAASLEVPYKGIDILLEALSHMQAPPRLRVAGDGRLRSELEARAVRAGLAERVTFLGRLSQDDVLDEMRRCDLYVQPSLTEGLPRAVIEAMATAAPVLGTNIGGLPELLRPEDSVPPGDARALAAMLKVVLSDPDRLNEMSIHSLGVAHRFEASELDARRGRLYAHLRARADEAAL